MNECSDVSVEARTVRRLRRVMAVFSGLLVASTWPLWKPGTRFPDIPWFRWAVQWPPDSWDWIWLGALGGLLLIQFLPPPNRRRWTTVLGSVLFGGALLLLPADQHRLQPWVWQMLLSAVLIGLARRPRLALEVLRGLTLSIYVWSAVSKFDWAFIDGHGQLLLQGLSASIGLSAEMWPRDLCKTLVLGFPVGELAVAILLAIPRTRLAGMVGAVAMHLGLILTLGPLGLRHESGVLIWNAYFIAQNILLFGGRHALAGDWDRSEPQHPRTQLTRILAIIVCLLPGLSIAGLWDWWPSWAVYSSRPAVVQMFVDEDDVDRLPESLQPYVQMPQPLSSWREVSLDAWSYELCWCPMYPQERYRMAVIQAIAVEAGIEPRVELHSPPDRWTGERVARRLSSQEIAGRMRTYAFNTQGRRARD